MDDAVIRLASVKKGLPFCDANQIVAHAVKAATSHQVDLSELPLPVLQDFKPTIGKDVYECLRLRDSPNTLTTLGGTAPVAAGVATADIWIFAGYRFTSCPAFPPPRADER